MALYPTTALQPGSTDTAAVKQLQDWLVSRGYMTQTQVNTGYGTYGPQTTAAVLAYQKAAGIDYSSGPGYWGPKSIAAASGTTTPTVTPAPTTTPTPTSTSSSAPAPSSSGGATAVGTSFKAPSGGTVNGDPIIATYTYAGNGQWNVSDTYHGDWGVTMPDSQVRSIPGAPQINTSTAAPASTSTVAPPTVALQPGSTNTTAVKQLQDYLVSKGLLTQDQVNTGYGTYGPQTTAAVQKLQEQLGVDNSSGVGYFGPKTLAAISSSTGTGATGPLSSILSNPNLTADQKAAIQSIYDAVSTNDASAADKIKAAMTAATQYSDPYFKAQTRLALDALDRGMNAKDGDLAYNEKQLTDALSALTDSTSASKDQLSFEHSQELKTLATKYETDLGTTQDNLAAAGFTSSSKRARAEDILGQNNTGLVESSNKKFAYDTGNLDRSLSTNEQSTQAQIANLQRLNAEGNLDLYRTTEGQVGSDNLPSMDGLTPLGGIGGSIPAAQAKDALSFASNFVT